MGTFPAQARGESLADGELIQVAHGNRVTGRIVFHFRDGSVQDEAVAYSQNRSFRLISDHLVQRGPAFPIPMEVRIYGRSGMVTVRYSEGGKEKTASERLDLPPDIANGMIFTLLKNVPPETRQLTLSMVATAPRPRLVKLVISPAGEDSFSIGASTLQATNYVLKLEIGGLAGVVAPLVGKQPPDSHVWIQGGTAQEPMCSGGEGRGITSAEGFPRCLVHLVQVLLAVVGGGFLFRPLVAVVLGPGWLVRQAGQRAPRIGARRWRGGRCAGAGCWARELNGHEVHGVPPWARRGR